MQKDFFVSLKRKVYEESQISMAYTVMTIFVACKDNTWVLDEESDPNNRRCLKLFTEKKTWVDARDHCSADGATLVKLEPRATQKLKGR